MVTQLSWGYISFTSSSRPELGLIHTIPLWDTMAVIVRMVVMAIIAVVFAVFVLVMIISAIV